MIFQHNQIKKITKALTLTFLVTCAAHAEAPQKKTDLTHEFMVGLESFKYHYGEKTPKSKNFMQLNGAHFGVSGAYQLTYKGVFVRPELRWAYGHADYTAGELGKNYELDKIPSMIFEPRLLLGIPFQTTKHLTLSPYSGIGWRYKRDDSTDIPNPIQHAGWNRINKFWYIPIGTRFQYDLSDRWNLNGFLEYDWFIRGRHSTYRKSYSGISDTGIPYYQEHIPATITHKQKEGWGVKAELLVGYSFDKVAVAFGPYMNYLHLQTSSPASQTLREVVRGIPYDFPNDSNEPNNTTKEIGLKVNFYF